MRSKNIMRTLFLTVALSLVTVLALPTNVALAGGPNDNGNGLPYVKHGKVTQADRLAAAQARAAANKKAGITPQAAALVTNPATGLQIPDYFGITPNYANSPTNIPKFTDQLPSLTIATADNTSYPGSDYYEIELVEYQAQILPTGMPTTTVRGYRQKGGVASYLGPVIIAKRDVPVRVKFTNLLPNTAAGGNLFIPVDTTYMGAGNGPSGEVNDVLITGGGSGYTVAPAVTVGKPGGGGTQATAEATIYKGAVNNIKITNPGSGYTTTPAVSIAAPAVGTRATATAKISATVAQYTQNRATLHLHGGTTPWISDGTPHQWITPATENTTYPHGVSVINVPDMPDPGPGSQTFFYSNQQSARLMFYHDHAYGITRLNVYAGEAAGYLLTDNVEQALINGGTVNYTDPSGTPKTATFAAGTLPGIGTPLVIQDKTFVDATKIAAQDPTWLDPALKLGSLKNGTAVTGDLWFPHVYMPNQNPYDITGANAMGRWDYGPWFWPPFSGILNGAVPNPYLATEPGVLTIPGTPDGRGISPSGVPESFMDTPIVNGKAYPTLTVQPGLTRFRILNAANDRFWNLQLYQANPGIVSGFTNLVGGSGYTSPPAVTISGGGGYGATAVTTVNATGSVDSISILTVGSGYTSVPLVTINPPPAGGTPASATATIYNAPTEVGMVPATPVSANVSWPAGWTVQTPGMIPDILDNRQGGVPDPAYRGPAMIQIGTEGGFLVAPAVLPNTPVGYEQNKRNIVVLNVAEKTLFLGPAERADVLVDFTNFAGKTLILYNDSPAPVPANDPRNDYYTGDPDNTSTGGAPTTLPGFGPNTRTIMQIVVGAGASSTAPVDDVPQAKLAALATALPAAFAASQDTIIVPQQAYSNAYPLQTMLTGNAQYVKIQDNSFPFDPLGPVGMLTMNLQPKAIQELFTVDYGRMNATLGVELPFTNGINQTTIPYGYVDPPTEVVAFSNSVVPIGTAGDGTQLWKITHNGVDTHAIHVHMFTAQVVNRVGWDGAIRPPDPNELGWKDTIRMNPLEDVIIALRPIVLTNVPFSVPYSTRPLDVTRALGTSGPQYFNVDPTGLPVTVVNHVVNFGWEYVWHCHLLGHEENDMMRPMALVPPPASPTNLTAALQGKKIRLNWTIPAGTTAVTVQRATDPLFTIGVTNFNLGAVSTYSDGAVTTGIRYYYRVFATGPVIGDSGTTNYPTLAATSAPSNSVNIVAP